MFCSPVRPGSCADITQARQLGLVTLLANGPFMEILADARSATTDCGASTAARRVPTTPWPRCGRSARPARTAPRSTSSWTTCPLLRARQSGTGPGRTGSSCASRRPTRPGPTRSRPTSDRFGSSPSPTPTTVTTPTKHGPCAGATPMPGTPTCSPLRGRSALASAARKASAGADDQPSSRDQIEPSLAAPPRGSSESCVARLAPARRLRARRNSRTWSSVRAWPRTACSNARSDSSRERWHLAASSRTPAVQPLLGPLDLTKSASALRSR